MIRAVVPVLMLIGIPVLAYAAEVAATPAVEVAFSPKQGATELVIKAISEAHKSIRVAAYSFTSRPIAQALVDAHKHGIVVMAVLDKSNLTARYSSATFLANMGIPTRIDSRYAIMHSKYILIDDDEVELGSFNYTKAAERSNAENVLVVRHAPTLASAYKANWQRLWDESEDVQARY